MFDENFEVGWQTRIIMKNVKYSKNNPFTKLSVTLLLFFVGLSTCFGADKKKTIVNVKIERVETPQKFSGKKMTFQQMIDRDKMSQEKMEEEVSGIKESYSELEAKRKELVQRIDNLPSSFLAIKWVKFSANFVLGMGILGVGFVLGRVYESRSREEEDEVEDQDASLRALD